MSRYNIPSTIQDHAYRYVFPPIFSPFCFRYTMPAMKLSKESRLNGVKTNVTNLTDVAAALRVPESAIIKWFCSKVGANSEGTSIIKGEHREPDLRVHLDSFIGKYVCCDNCKYPELAYQIKGKKNLVGVCNSCGKEKQLDT